MEIRKEEEYVYVTLRNGTTLSIKEESEGIVLDFWEDIQQDTGPVEEAYYFYDDIGKGVHHASHT